MITGVPIDELEVVDLVFDEKSKILFLMFKKCIYCLKIGYSVLDPLRLLSNLGASDPFISIHKAGDNIFVHTEKTLHHLTYSDMV